MPVTFAVMVATVQLCQTMVHVHFLLHRRVPVHCLLDEGSEAEVRWGWLSRQQKVRPRASVKSTPPPGIMPQVKRLQLLLLLVANRRDYDGQRDTLTRVALKILGRLVQTSGYNGSTQPPSLEGVSLVRLVAC